ncbi:MAG: hypothetical protein AAF353_14025 [Pseudomonadota bacterium]
MELSAPILCILAAIMLVPLCLAWFRRFKGLKYQSCSAKTFSQLSNNYAHWEKRVTLITLSLTLLIAMLLWQLLMTIQTSRIAHLESLTPVLGMPDIVWFLAALFLARFLVAIPMHYLLLMWLGRRRHGEFIDYENRKHGMDCRKLFRCLANIFIPLCLSITLLLLDNWVRLTEKALVINDFWSLGEQSYPLNRLERIESYSEAYYPNDKHPTRWHYRFSFNDGHSIEYDHRNPVNYESWSTLVTEVSRLTGLPVSIARQESIAMGMNHYGNRLNE